MLLPHKSDPFSELEAKVWRSTVRQERHTPTLQVTIDGETTILPYSYFQEARIHRQGKTWQIVLYWPSNTVTVKGQNLEEMARFIAEENLASLEFHPHGEKHTREDLADFDSVTVSPREENPISNLPAAPDVSKGLVHHRCYSVIRP